MPGKLKHSYTLPKELIEMSDMFPKASSAALNRVVRSARTQVSRDIRDVYNMKARDVSRVITVSQSSPKRLIAILKTAGRNIPLIFFDAKQKNIGVSVKIKRGARKTIRGAFLATMPSGHTGVFMRKGKGRLPIKELRTIGLPAMFNSKLIREKLIQFIGQNLGNEVTRTVKAFRQLGRE